jgi:penicillin-insensitive murein endopeptidase
MGGGRERTATSSFKQQTSTLKPMTRTLPPLLSSLFILFLAANIQASDMASTCYGTTSNGRLVNGVSLPLNGDNFRSYSSIGNILGRTYLHSEAKNVVMSAFKTLEETDPGKVFQYGETGLENGGIFKPHKTHQNGLSVDFMVPVIDETGVSTYLPTKLFNKFGYGIEFDDAGAYKTLNIDFEAIASHLVALDNEAEKAGISIWRVIFDPQLQRHLFQTSNGAYLQKNITFSKKPSWVRHDEHYHVDFRVECEPL